MTKAIIFLALASVLTCQLMAQETRREIVNPAPNPADDAKPNSDKVPDVFAISGRFDRVVVLRFKRGTDLLAGLEKMVKQDNIHNAVLLSIIGSVTSYHVHAVSSRTFPPKDTFIKNPTAPADLISINGYVIDGRVHAHITMANPVKAFGGHLEPGNTVFTFAVVTLGVMNHGVDFAHLDDRNYR
jgi:predicted DNA-binding protein with PD1-like motif